MKAEILLDRKVVIDVQSFVAERADKNFLVLFLILGAVMRLNGRMVGAKYFGAILAFDRKPVFLFAGIEGAVLAYILIEHLKYF